MASKTPPQPPAVADVVLWTEQGMCPDEIVTEFPQLRLADVSAAVAYYHDNRELIDRQINESVEGADGRGVHPTSDLLLLD